MLTWITEKLEQLFNSLVDPIWKKILAMPWISRLSIFTLCGMVSVMGSNWESTKHFLTVAERLYSVTLHNKQTKMPLSEDDLMRVQEEIERLAISIQADFSNQKIAFTTEQGPWAPAQMTVALNSLFHLQADQLTTYFESQSDLSCHCWREFPKTASPRHVLVSGWVLLALSALNSPVSSNKVQFLLDAQSTEGWWSMFLYSNPEQENASTYATAFSLLALNELLSHGEIAREQVIAVNDSIKRGKSWLFNHKVSNVARWLDYPLSTKGKVSLSLSGLVIYTLHQLDKTNSFDHEWLAELPESLPSADTCEHNIIWTDTLDGPYQDHNCKLVLPWLLAATADAYQNGDLSEKAKAILWVERALNETNILSSETLPYNWNRAENLIALEQLVARN